jgi:hypothetical protein
MICEFQLRLQSKRPLAPTTRLTGTYDFRWPRGTIIRIAFQKANNAVLQVARANIAAALESWGVYPKLKKDGPAVGYVFLAETLQAGKAMTEKEIGDAKAVLQAQIDRTEDGQKERFKRERDGFLREAAKANAARPDAQHLNQEPPLEYDVLISLADLPLVIPKNEHIESVPRVSLYAQAELGAYAKREDYGLPTAYLGCPPSFREGGSADDRAIAWLNSDEGKFTTAHEVGHLLGLVHEHQNPQRTIDWLNDEVILKDLIKVRQGDPIYEDFVKLVLTQKWPIDPEERFSQWRTPANPFEQEIDSVMAEPIHLCAQKTSPGQHDCLGRVVCQHEQAFYARFAGKASASDRAQLKVIYPPLPEQL